MSKLTQLIRSKRCAKKRRSLTPELRGNPQKKATCIKIFIQTPKKPNSAKRSVARVMLASGRLLTAYIPGEGHSLQRYSVVLLRGGRVRDLPGVRYKTIRGAHDLPGVKSRLTARSKYGTKK
jgi:small subunit ribosomal protein S12